MKGIVYLSHAQIEFSEEKLAELASAASNKNDALGITGYLCFIRDKFIQYIEGKDEVVTDLIDTIRADERHNVIHQIEKNNLAQRKFPTWGMRHITIPELQRFNIEPFIAQNIAFIKNDLPLQERRKQMLWDEIDAIANIQKQLRCY